MRTLPRDPINQLQPLLKKLGRSIDPGILRAGSIHAGHILNALKSAQRKTKRLLLNISAQWHLIFNMCCLWSVCKVLHFFLIGGAWILCDMAWPRYLNLCSVRTSWLSLSFEHVWNIDAHIVSECFLLGDQYLMMFYLEWNYARASHGWMFFTCLAVCVMAFDHFWVVQDPALLEAAETLATRCALAVHAALHAMHWPMSEFIGCDLTYLGNSIGSNW